MKKYNTVKNALIGLGLIALALNLFVVFTYGSFSEQWVDLLFSITPVVIGLSLGSDAKLE